MTTLSFNVNIIQMVIREDYFKLFITFFFIILIFFIFYLFFILFIYFIRPDFSLKKYNFKFLNKVFDLIDNFKIKEKAES